MEKAFSRGKKGKRPEKGRTGKRANEIECPEKGKGKAPDLKSEARVGAGRSASGEKTPCGRRSVAHRPVFRRFLPYSRDVKFLLAFCAAD